MNIGKYLELYSKELKFKNYSENTIKNYVFQVDLFLRYFEKVATKPSEINETQIKTWLMLANTLNSRKHKMCSVKLFYKFVGKQPLKFKNIEYPRSEKHLPRVIDKEYLLTCISKIDNLKHKAIITLTFSTAIRVSEVINLKLSDIDYQRNIIFIRNAKGNKDRIVPLSKNVSQLLKSYIDKYDPKEYVFNGQFDLQYSSRSCNEIVKKYLNDKSAHFHLLRHASATAMVESGTDINLIQKILGHSNVKTSMVYVHVSNNLLSKIQLPC
jgi:site-specific recombinase XerD